MHAEWSARHFLAQEREGIVLTVKFILNETFWLYIQVGFFFFSREEVVVGSPGFCALISRWCSTSTSGIEEVRCFPPRHSGTESMKPKEESWGEISPRAPVLVQVVHCVRASSWGCTLGQKFSPSSKSPSHGGHAHMGIGCLFQRSEVRGAQGWAVGLEVSEQWRGGESAVASRILFFVLQLELELWGHVLPESLFQWDLKYWVDHKSSFGLFPEMLWKNPNQLVGQPSRRVKRYA